MNPSIRRWLVSVGSRTTLLTDAQLAHYESAYRKDYEAWAEVLGENIERIRRGSFSLHWLNTDGGHWGKRAKPSSRGLTYREINRVRGYGDIPEHADWFNFAPRGSIREPRARMPMVDDYTVTARDELWADNVITLYEEAKAASGMPPRTSPGTNSRRYPRTWKRPRASCARS